MKIGQMYRLVIKDHKGAVLYLGPWTTRNIDVPASLLGRSVGSYAYVDYGYVVTEEDEKTPGQLLYEAHCRIETDLGMGNSVPWNERDSDWRQAYERLAAWKENA